MKNWVAKILGIVAITVFVFGCKKNDGAGRLYLKIKDMSSTTFREGGIIPFEFQFSHPNSESQTDSLFWYRKFFNCPAPPDTTRYFVIPEFISTKDQLGDLSIDYKLIGAVIGVCRNGSVQMTDSCNYFFFLKDKNGNISDTVKSPKLILKP